jgi:hypothetical protein
MSKHRVMLPLNIKRGEHGLFYITCPVIRGLLVAEPTFAKALAEVQTAIDELADAASIAKTEEERP